MSPSIASETAVLRNTPVKTTPSAALRPAKTSFAFAPALLEGRLGTHGSAVAWTGIGIVSAFAPSVVFVAVTLCFGA